MAKRYGRNQKRHHREEIEALKASLHLAITGGFAPATGHPDAFQLDKAIGVPISVEIKDMEDGFTIRREATLTFAPHNRCEVKKAMIHMSYSGLVEWRGILWQAAPKWQVDPGRAFFDMGVMEIELRAIETRDSRRPLSTSMDHRVIGHRNTSYSYERKRAA
jgi:hypothetical protein